MQKINLSLLVLFLIIVGCRKSEISKSESNNYQLQKILTDHKSKLIEIDKKYNINGQKEILNELMKNNDFFDHSNYRKTIQKLKEAETYFDTIQNKNDVVFANTLKQIESINQFQLSTNEISEINDALTGLTLLKVNGSVYNIQMTLLISKIVETVNYVESCKHIIEKNEVLFYDETCLQKYNALIEEIQKLQVKCNEIKSKYADISALYK